MAEEHDPRFDAQTLAEAEVIKADGKRLERAQTAAAGMSKDALVRAKSLDEITKNTYPSMDKRHYGRVHSDEGRPAPAD